MKSVFGTELLKAGKMGGNRGHVAVLKFPTPSTRCAATGSGFLMGYYNDSGEYLRDISLIKFKFGK